ncbi:MAG TPA: CPXCG motif-containing cysteine-rich protein [Myxococcaceae bacterium]|nr:CPXCG motif-containing cysteine-rich protein [Myxococcaceae bacterium]
MAGVDPELLAGARLLGSGAWRASHEAFEVAWRRSEGDGRDLLQALAQLAAAMLKWSEGRLDPAATLLGRVRRRLEGLPSRVSRVDVETLESTVLGLQEGLARRAPAPAQLRLPLEGRAHAPADRVAAGAVCPYCGERVTVQVEPTGMSVEQYVEDCPVCCRPWVVRVERGPSGPGVSLAREDE